MAVGAAVAVSLMRCCCAGVTVMAVVIVRESSPKEGTSSTERMICDGCLGS